MSKRVLTTESGAPVADNQNSATAGVGGPLLLQDQHLLEKLARFNRERIPERVVHARGSGAYGYFEVTDDVTGFTHADFLDTVGKRTEIVHPLLHRRRQPGRRRRGPRPARLRAEVLHRRGQLRPRRQQHPGVLHQGPHQVPRLHPLPEARPVHGQAGAGQRLGLLGARPRGHAPDHLADGRPRHPGLVPPHERLRLAHLPVDERRGRGLLRQVPLQDEPGHPLPLRRAGRRDSRARTPTRTRRTCSRPSSAA